MDEPLLSSVGVAQHNPESPIPMGMLKNPKDEAFCQHYAQYGNASEAWRLATGYTRDADSRSHSLMVKTGIKERISEIRQELAEEVAYTRQEALKDLVSIIKAAPAEASEDGALCEMRMGKSGPYYTFPDKLKALERLAKMLGWDEPEKVAVEHSLNEGRLAVLMGVK